MIFATLLSSFAFAQEHPRTPRKYDFALSDMAKRLTPVIGFNKNMHPAGWVWKEGRSSALVEKGKPSDFYEINKIDDENPECEGSSYMIPNAGSAWVEGARDDGIGEWVIIPIKPQNDDVAMRLTNCEIRYPLHVSLDIWNGFQRSLDLYRKNNRVKEAKISIYAAAMSFGQDDAFLLWNPEVVHEEKITLSDEIEENPFCFNSTNADFSFELPEKYRSEMCELYLKLEILSVYKGTKYSDTCICDMRATVEEELPR